MISSDAVNLAERAFWTAMETAGYGYSKPAAKALLEALRAAEPQVTYDALRDATTEQMEQIVRAAAAAATDTTTKAKLREIEDTIRAGERDRLRRLAVTNHAVCTAGPNASRQFADLIRP